MALDKGPLKTALEASLSSYPSTAAAAAAAWAAAYETYAQGGRSCQGAGPGSLAAAKATLEAALTAAFQDGTAAGASSAMAAAFTAFWLTPPVTFAGSTPGVVTAVTGTAAFSAALSARFTANAANPNLTFSDAAQGFADDLDLVLTKTVVVTHSAPGACAAPLV